MNNTTKSAANTKDTKVIVKPLQLHAVLDFNEDYNQRGIQVFTEYGIAGERQTMSADVASLLMGSSVPMNSNFEIINFKGDVPLTYKVGGQSKTIVPATCSEADLFEYMDAKIAEIAKLGKAMVVRRHQSVTAVPTSGQNYQIAEGEMTFDDVVEKQLSVYPEIDSKTGEAHEYAGQLIKYLCADGSTAASFNRTSVELMEINGDGSEFYSRSEVVNDERAKTQPLITPDIASKLESQNSPAVNAPKLETTTDVNTTEAIPSAVEVLGATTT